MKSYSFAKALTLGCLVCLLLPVACGDDDDSPPGPSGGSTAQGGESNGGEAAAGGAKPNSNAIPGTSKVSETIECGAADCKSTSTKLGVFINPCCTQAEEACGVDSDFLQVLGTDLGGVCLPKDQEGTEDASCPDSPAQAVDFRGSSINVKPFVGCCRAATGTCGFIVNAVEADIIGVVTSPELGCVDSAAFTQMPGAKCGEGAGGGGAGGSGAGGGGGAGGNGDMGGAGGVAP